MLKDYCPSYVFGTFFQIQIFSSPFLFLNVFSLFWLKSGVEASPRFRLHMQRGAGMRLLRVLWKGQVSPEVKVALRKRWELQRHQQVLRAAIFRVFPSCSCCWAFHVEAQTKGSRRWNKLLEARWWESGRTEIYLFFYFFKSELVNKSRSILRWK